MSFVKMMIAQFLESLDKAFETRLTDPKDNGPFILDASKIKVDFVIHMDNKL